MQVLLSFRVANYRSIKNAQEFSFVRGSPTASSLQAHGDSDHPRWNPNIGSVAGIFGGNASGKSNILSALGFMRTAIVQSYRTWSSTGKIPIQPFRLDRECIDSPSLFEAVFIVNSVRYQYGFQLNSREIVKEWLYAYTTNRRQVWFERDINSEDPWYFGKSFPGRNRVIADLTTPTSLFLSAAVGNNHQLALDVDRWFRRHLAVMSPGERTNHIRYSQSLAEDQKQWAEITELMRYADLGIQEARIRKDELDSDIRDRIARMFRAIDLKNISDDASIQKIIDETSTSVEFGHAVDGQTKPIYLPFNSESLGTQTWFGLSGAILRAVSAGDTLLIDELDSSLHPRLVAEVLNIFRSPEKNPKQAQVIFTTHDTTLLGNMLGDRELARDQIWFTEKALNGATTLYPLTDFSPRASENLERGYLQGRYGAIPYLEDARVSKALRSAGSRPERDNHDLLTDLLGGSEGAAE